VEHVYAAANCQNKMNPFGFLAATGVIIGAGLSMDPGSVTLPIAMLAAVPLAIGFAAAIPLGHLRDQHMAEARKLVPEPTK
jgi:hypothetical protein